VRLESDHNNGVATLLFAQLGWVPLPLCDVGDGLFQSVLWMRRSVKRYTEIFRLRATYPTPPKIDAKCRNRSSLALFMQAHAFLRQRNSPDVKIFPVIAAALAGIVASARSDSIRSLAGGCFGYGNRQADCTLHFNFHRLSI
jgi:hypothetical protein